MSKKKVVDINEYKSQQLVERQIRELDEIYHQQYHEMSDVEKRGYRNFMRLLRALDEKYKK